MRRTSYLTWRSRTRALINRWRIRSSFENIKFISLILGGELHKTFFFTKLQILFHVKYCDTAHNFSFCPPSPYESVLNSLMDRVLFNLKFSFKLSLFLCRNWNINQPTVRPVTSRVYKFNIFFYESWRGGRGYEKKSLGCIVNCLLCMGYYVFQRKFYFF